MTRRTSRAWVRQSADSARDAACRLRPQIKQHAEMFLSCRVSSDHSLLENGDRTGSRTRPQRRRPGRCSRERSGASHRCTTAALCPTSRSTGLRPFWRDRDNLPLVIDVSVLRLLLVRVTGWLDRREREALA
jgi:hypothetical protein